MVPVFDSSSERKAQQKVNIKKVKDKLHKNIQGKERSAAKFFHTLTLKEQI